jgi:NTE family protein
MAPEQTEGVFAIFQGGGAKGMSHVGALAAAEKQGFWFYGVAGTSAGAIMAALVAAGYTARELFDPANPSANLLAANTATPLDILGRGRWASFDRLMRAFRGGNKLLIGLLVVLSPVLIVVVLVSLLFRRLFQTRGYFTTRNAQKLLNTVLRNRVQAVMDRHGHGEAPQVIRFRDLDFTRYPGAFVPLKIISTNTQNRSVELFDLKSTPDVPVATAVAASMAIPLFFEPVELTGGSGGAGEARELVDGGLVSNLPVWAFVEEKRRIERSLGSGERVRTLAFTLADKKNPDGAGHDTGQLQRLLAFVATVLQAGLSGSQGVAERFVSDLEIVPVESNLSLLSFDASLKKLEDAYLDGYNSAWVRLGEISASGAGRLGPLLEGVCTAIARLGVLEDAGGIRATVYHASGDYLLVPRARAGQVGPSHDLDDRLVRDIDDDVMQSAIHAREPRLRQLTPDSFGYMLPSERALVPGRIAWGIFIPLFATAGAYQAPAGERTRPTGVLAIESAHDLSAAFRNSAFPAMVEALADTLSTSARGQS